MFKNFFSLVDVEYVLSSYVSTLSGNVKDRETDLTAPRTPTS
jgi:hypothetical protein